MHVFFDVVVALSDSAHLFVDHLFDRVAQISAALGRYSSRIVTLRGVGYRFEA